MKFSKTQRLKIARGIQQQAWGFRKQGEVLPTWFITRDNGETQVVATPFEEGVPKEVYAVVVAEKVRELQPVQFVMSVADGWMLTYNSVDEMRQGPRPSESPDACEYLSVHCWMRTGPGFALLRKYRERDDGSLEILSDETMSDEYTTTETFAAVLEALRSVSDN